LRSQVESVLALARTLDVSEVEEFLGDLERCRVAALSILMQPQPKPKDEWLTVAEASKKIHKSADWIYRTAKAEDWPFAHRMGNRLLLSAKGIDAYLKNQSR
jgi:predicted DNA-binding transcriptional regulator AlpA